MCAGCVTVKRGENLRKIVAISGTNWSLLCVHRFRYFSHNGMGEISPLPSSYSKKFVTFLKVKNKGMLDSPFQIGESFTCMLLSYSL